MNQRRKSNKAAGRHVLDVYHVKKQSRHFGRTLNFLALHSNAKFALLAYLCSAYACAALFTCLRGVLYFVPLQFARDIAGDGSIDKAALDADPSMIYRNALSRFLFIGLEPKPYQVRWQIPFRLAPQKAMECAMKHGLLIDQQILKYVLLMFWQGSSPTPEQKAEEARNKKILGWVRKSAAKV
eukprot:scaffold159900_cov38-Prasinocladus_malaysianus.AAC.1